MWGEKYEGAPCPRCSGTSYYISNKKCFKCSQQWALQNRLTRRERNDMRGQKCAICPTIMTSPCYDHDALSGEFRGWLCHNCNRALGLFKDSPILLTNALMYLGG